ncbi:AraC family transcriptional regulator [Roseovarius aestuarii]|uniref:HTH-type transcriptional regulator YesS n=1 Tax=Roseovarius aestuarii TaxID=475083 RepID=A0A1X7BML5_9RHOB|nr:AraC family transcriptional regulator [Roseovarius aestuarii]SMC10872.1 HTH-type transcriptional regulator YesS [Roseovarius aestuarii]
MTDLLSDILMRLSMKGTLYFRASFRPPWGVRVPSYSNVARFHFVHRGECMIRHEKGGDPLRLAQGDLVIIPGGAGHSLYCQPETELDALPLETVLERAGYDGEGVLFYPGDDKLEDRETQLICGHFSIAEGQEHPIFDRLPPFVHIPDYGAQAGQWMEATLRMIGAETGAQAMGANLIALKLSETIFAQAIRAFLSSPEAEGVGLSGFVDPQLARALRMIHADPSHGWTLDMLAREAGMSRTGFAVRFSDKVGMPPLQYVTYWRMQLACQALRETGRSVAEVAAEVGYSSESGFSRVFKKEKGLPPAKYRAAMAAA